MKKLNLLYILLLPTFFMANSVVAQDCVAGTATETLDANNTYANLNNTGAFLYSSGEGAFIYPASNLQTIPINSIFAASLWVGGLDPGGNLKLAAPTYGSSFGASDIWPGPIFPEWGIPVDEACADWDRMFKVSKENIDAHMADFADNGIIDGPIPNDVLLWPGASNPNILDGFGFDMDDYDYATLAPFHDENGDGRYIPADGDYPNVQGATKAVWWVVNDAAEPHFESGGDRLSIQINYLALSYESTDEVINNTTFFKAMITNYGIESLDNLQVSLWVDADLGCFDDDYFGSMPSENLAYVYNADPVDGDENCLCPAGINTYCESPPVLTFKILDGVKDEDTLEENGMTSFMLYHNGGVGNPPPGTTDPSIPLEFYNYMSGNWRDGTPLTYGGFGYNPSSSDEVTFAYSGMTDQGDWTMCGEQIGAMDSRMVISSGSGRLEPGGSEEFVFAISGIPNLLGPCDDSLPIIEGVSQVLENFYSEELVSIKDEYLSTNAISVFPNPMTESTTFTFGQFAGEIESVELFAIDGKLVKSIQKVSDELKIQKENLNAGMYFYKVRTSGQKLISGKLMIL